MNSFVILMADMVDSTIMPQPFTQNLFKQHVKWLNMAFKNAILSPITITLGDEFQGVIKSKKEAIELVITYQEKLTFLNFPYKMRFVISEGIIQSDLNTENALGMVGDGLTKARKKLEALKKTKEWLFVNKNNKEKNFEDIAQIFGLFYRKWEQKQDGKLLEHFINGEHYNKIAKLIGKTPSAVWKKKNALEINAYFALKNLVHDFNF